LKENAALREEKVSLQDRLLRALAEAENTRRQAKSDSRRGAQVCDSRFRA